MVRFFAVFVLFFGTAISSSACLGEYNAHDTDESNRLIYKRKAINTAISTISRLCESDNKIELRRIDLTHGFAWLVYVFSECNSVGKYYLVYISSKGEKVLNYHEVKQKSLPEIFD